jgi:hypothetical protein
MVQNQKGVNVDEFTMKLGLVFIAVAVVCYFANKAQKRKEKAADDQFNLTLMSYGMKNEIQERPKIDPFAKIATRADLEVRDVLSEDVVLNKVVKITKKVPKRKVVKKKSNKKK